jgi:Putative prokaryotic signal transducing protein
MATEEVVTIAGFSEPLEADMARLRLESAGIEVFLSGENARIMEPGLGPLQLQVRAEDEADARAILSDPGDAGAAERAEQEEEEEGGPAAR